MSVQSPREALPAGAIPALVGLVVGSLLFTVLVEGTLSGWFFVAWSAAQIAAVLVALYLLYRLVVAVERIAEKL